jgi:hypothetical protein
VIGNIGPAVHHSRGNDNNVGMAQLETCKHLASLLARGEVPSTGLIGPAVVCYFVRRLPEGVVR